MAKAKIYAGICGFNTIVIARKDENGMIQLDIESDCKGVRKFADQLKEVDPFREFTYRRGGPITLQVAPQCLTHPACPVPSGVIKAIEVEAGLALPKDVTIKLSKDEA
jgi:hypothetical protein